MNELIAGAIIDLLITVISLLLVKKNKPNKRNLLNMAFGTFWLGSAGIYFFALLSDLSGIFNSVYFSKLFFSLAIILAVIPFVSISLFLSATSFKGKTIWILPGITTITGLIYVYFNATAAYAGPLIGWTLKYIIQSKEALLVTQYAGYFSFVMVALLALIAFRARKTSTFIQFNSVAVSMGLFFVAGYLDLIGSTGIETVLIRTIIVIGALIGFFGFSPGIKLMKLAHRLS